MTLFFIMSDGTVIRKVVDSDRPLYGQAGMHLASRAEQIVAYTLFGKGRTLKNRHSEHPQLFTRDEMIMLSLRATPISTV